MMQSIYAKRYGDGSHENDVSGVIEANAVVVKPAHVTPVKMTANYVPASPTTAPSMASTATQSPTKFTRVLWDIENIRVSKLGGLETVSRLQAFLSHHNALSPGVDFRITVSSELIHLASSCIHAIVVNHRIFTCLFHDFYRVLCGYVCPTPLSCNARLFSTLLMSQQCQKRWLSR